MKTISIKSLKVSFGQCGTVGWSISFGPKDYGFNSLSGHILRLHVQSPGQAHIRWQLVSISLSPFLSKGNEKMSFGEDKKKFES